MSNTKARDKSPNLLSTVFGSGMLIVALLLSIPVVPMLLFARDSRDVTGGLVGMVVVGVLLLTGVVLLLREKTPMPLQRGFYLFFGTVAIVTGVGILAWTTYQFLNAVDVNFRAIPAAGLFAFVGVTWIRRGLSPDPAAGEDESERSQQQLDAAA